MNIPRAIYDNVNPTIMELVEERNKLVSRVFEINREIAVLQTLVDLGLPQSHTEGE
jgi:hypothetical protein